MLKSDFTLSAQALHPIFSRIWEDELFLDDWLQDILVKIPKKGDLSLCDFVFPWPFLHISYQHSPYHRQASERISAKLTPDLRGLPEGLRHVKTRHCMAGDGKEGDTKQTAKLSQGTVYQL
ncbi:hypothetical protein ILUMI_14637 [Ignelater luminosus]|uniref:Uncharacterized protein n=1 Tax=Ignelater luminosus TaxID=2038154 RepID=A0A8K0G7K7_IGNLU|nr:hypothetical protein ILUMI_14637 [Ignelater luminosus]